MSCPARSALAPPWADAEPCCRSRGWRGTRGRREQSSELVPCPSDTRAPHTASGAVVTLAACGQHPRALLGMQPFATASKRPVGLPALLAPSSSRALLLALCCCVLASSPPQRCQGPSHAQNQLGLKVVNTRWPPKSFLKGENPQGAGAVGRPGPPTGCSARRAGMPAGRKHRVPKSRAGRKPPEPTPHQLGLGSLSISTHKRQMGYSFSHLIASYQAGISILIICDLYKDKKAHEKLHSRRADYLL